MSNIEDGGALQIIAAHPEATIVFWGDSVGDLKAAQEAGIAFVAVINERDNFTQHDIVKLGDFNQLNEVEHCIKSALQLIPVH